MSKKVSIPEPDNYLALPQGVVVDVTVATGQVRVTFKELSANGMGEVMSGEAEADSVEAAVAAAQRVLRGGTMETRGQFLFREVYRMRGEVNP